LSIPSVDAILQVSVVSLDDTLWNQKHHQEGKLTEKGHGHNQATIGTAIQEHMSSIEQQGKEQKCRVSVDKGDGSRRFISRDQTVFFLVTTHLIASSVISAKEFVPGGNLNSVVIAIAVGFKVLVLKKSKRKKVM
jgi:hypothetical protein